MFGMMALMSEDDSDSNGGADETKDDNNAPMSQARPAATEVHFQHKVKNLLHTFFTYGIPIYSKKKHECVDPHCIFRVKNLMFRDLVGPWCREGFLFYKTSLGKMQVVSSSSSLGHSWPSAGMA